MPTDMTSDAAPGAVSSWGERAAGVLFLATCLHLVFLQPWVEVIPGERAKVFSGICCALTLVLALVFHRSKAVSWKSPAVLLSLTLLILVTISSLRSPARASSLARAFVIMSAGLGGYWSARLLLVTPERQRTFLWFSLGLLAVCPAGVRRRALGPGQCVLFP